MSDDNREFVQLAPNEDANSVRDRLAFLRGKQVLLIWPEEGTALTRRLDLVLIQREAMRRAIKLALVTHDAEVIQNAKELNISTFETIAASERARWRRGRSKVPTNRNQRPKDAPDHDKLQPVASRVRGNKITLPAAWQFFSRVFLLVMLVGVVGTVAYVVVPGATVTLIPAEQFIQADVDITVSTDPNFNQIDIDNAIIPAVLLQVSVEDTATVSTTGQVDLGNARAVGSVIFFNETDDEISIPTGTTVSTSDDTPILFRTTVDTSLPGGEGQQIEVPIEAVSNSDGAVGNIQANQIDTVVGPLENSVNVFNPDPTTGGVRQVARSVTERDLEIARGGVINLLQQRAADAMLTQPGMSDTHFVIEQTIAIPEIREDQTSYDAEVGDIAETLSVTMRATVEALAIDEQLARQVVFARMASQIPRGRAIQQDTIRYELGEINVVGDTIQFRMSGTGLVTGQINTTQLQQQLARRSRADALNYLLQRVDLAEGTTPQITLTPDWFDQMPFLPTRITIIVQQPRGAP